MQSPMSTHTHHPVILHHLTRTSSYLPLDPQTTSSAMPSTCLDHPAFASGTPPRSVTIPEPSSLEFAYWCKEVKGRAAPQLACCVITYPGVDPIPYTPVQLVWIPTVQPVLLAVQVVTMSFKTVYDVES